MGGALVSPGQALDNTQTACVVFLMVFLLDLSRSAKSWKRKSVEEDKMGARCACAYVYI